MKNRNSWKWIIGFMIIIFTYLMIFLIPQHNGFKFVQKRLSFMGEDHIVMITKERKKQILASELGLEFNFKDLNSYIINNDNNKIIVLEYKSDVDSTNDKSKFSDYIQNKTKSTSIEVPNFNTINNIKTQLNDLNVKIQKIKRLSNNFEFNANSNYIILKLKGTTSTLDKIVRSLH